MIRPLLLPAAALALLMSHPALGDEPTVDGTWLATSAELGGQKLPKKVTDLIKLTLKDGKYEVTAESPDRGTVTYDAAAKPKTMDIKGLEGPNKGKTYLAIYELSEEKLTICYDLSGESRPEAFQSLPKTKLFLVTYKRQKP